MIRDTLLICSVVICLVLFYRMYVLNQKINNLEEKVSVIDNFSQSIFNFVTSKTDSKDEVKEVTYSNNNVLPVNKLTPIVESNINAEEESDSDTESEHNIYKSSNDKKDDEKSETGESKELLSEMVAELKNSLIKSSNEDLTNDLSQIQELKEELKETNEVKDSNELFNLLNNVPTENIVSMDNSVENVQTEKNSKKKVEDLNKMTLTDLKALAKKKNIPIMISNKPKNKGVLISDLLKVM